MKTATTDGINLQRVGEAAFKAGWYAACQTIADMCAEAGSHPQTVQMFRDLSADPPNLVVGEGKTPPTHETVMVQTFPRTPTEKP